VSCGRGKRRKEITGHVVELRKKDERFTLDEIREIKEFPKLMGFEDINDYYSHNSR
jgi:hypothetical protein